MKIEPNSPVMPYKQLEYSGHREIGDILVHKSGISIRAHFASLAMNGIVSNSSHHLEDKYDHEYVVKVAVNIADLLIAELNK